MIKERTKLCRKILVVEDDETMRSALVIVLRSTRFSVLEARNAKEAMNIINQHAVDLIITDLFLNGQSGLYLYWLYHRIIPVLIITGHEDSYLTREAAYYAGEFFMKKPFSAEMLRQKVNRMLADPGK